MKRKSFLIFCLMTVHFVKAQVAEFDSDKPAAVYNSAYSQVFNIAWEGPKFYNQWDAMEANTFTAADIASGYLKFAWIKKRIICSKAPYITPYIIKTDIDYTGGSNRGGVIIRAKPIALDQLQEPATGDPGFNSEGIAFYPSEDGSKMTVQFTGTYANNKTPVTKIMVPKHADVTDLKNRGTLRIEDFGTSVYVYYNDIPFIRINLTGKTGSLYTSGTVYDANMRVVGDFSGMEVENYGKVAIAQRDAELKLYSVDMQFITLKTQTISFNTIGVKKSNDEPFLLEATASSGLPVAFRVVSGPATIIGNQVILSGAPGMLIIAASQEGNSEYFYAEEVKQTVFVESNSVSNETVQLKAFGDNWVATDDIGRTLPDYSDCGGYRDKKYVGIFYWLWHASLSRFGPIKTFPDLLRENPDSPAFEFATTYYWGEPEDGFYHPSDPWSTRRNLQMLANAGVDFVFFDFTNGDQGEKSLESFMTVALDMYNKGIPVPKISFFMNENYHLAMPSVLDKIYSHPEYDPLIFKWQGKPLLMADTVKCAAQWPEVNDRGIKDHFTWRKTWAFDANQWNFLDTYPQDYVSFNGIPEQIPVCKALGAPLFGLGQGSSMHNQKSPPYDKYWETEQSKYGYAFEEQWSRAHEIDPSIICVTGWNELTANAWISDSKNAIPFMLKNWNDPSWRCINQVTCPSKDADGNHIAHGWHVVDEFNKEFNRDICPMKDDITDNYYYQLVSHIRKFKGMSAPEAISASKTVTIDGIFDEWIDVTPVFKDAEGDVSSRNFTNVFGTGTYTNTTARNDITESGTTFDDSFIYFFVKTLNSVTPSTGKNWMLLFLDTDRNKGTGWEGYDFAVNLEVVSDTSSTVKRWNGRQWENVGSVVYRVKGNEMELSVPRNVLGLSAGTPEFYFHWADNPQHLNDITCFFTDGESAPDRRFNYNFSTSRTIIQDQSAFKNLVIPGTIEFEDFDNGGAGVAYADADIANQGGKYRNIESVDIAQKAENEYCLFKIIKEEWLEYSVKVNAIGKFKAAIHYLAETSGNKALLSFDGQLMTDTIPLLSTAGKWSTLNLDLQLTAGQKLMKFSIVEAAEDLKLDKLVISELDVVYPGAGKGLEKTFWTGEIGGRNWFKDSVCTEIDPVIDETWADVSPGCNLPKDFWNVRWLGKIEPLYSEEYTFYLTVNNMGRLWVNDVLVIDAWISTATGKTHTGKISLVAGQKVNIRVDFAEVSGDANVKLEWESQSNSREVVPQNQLYAESLNTSAKVLKTREIKVYPNPANDRITIEGNSNEIKNLTITDICGRIVFETREPFRGIKTIDTSYLKNGIYILKLGAEKQEYVKKIIKR